MDFTREPIIETIVTPMEGYNLIVRSSKGTAQEEFVVDAVEVVSFGHSFFFRSLEKPKAFLVPISDYEILEVKETRVVLKNASFERSVKIGGGREASLKVKEVASVEQTSTEEENAPSQEQRSDKKRDRRQRNRRRRHEGREPRDETSGREKQASAESKQPEQTSEETPVPPQTFSRLFPPPPTLISEKLAKIREQNPEFFEKEIPPKKAEEKPPVEVEKKEEDTGAEPRDMSRLSSEIIPPIQRTSFLSLDSWFKR